MVVFFKMLKLSEGTSWTPMNMCGLFYVRVGKIMDIEGDVL